MLFGVQVTYRSDYERESRPSRIMKSIVEKYATNHFKILELLTFKLDFPASTVEMPKDRFPNFIVIICQTSDIVPSFT